jgi:hypothetical protein
MEDQSNGTFSVQPHKIEGSQIALEKLTRFMRDTTFQVPIKLNQHQMICVLGNIQMFASEFSKLN